MDDRTRERQIVEEGRKQGKSDDFIKQAILRDRQKRQGDKSALGNLSDLFFGQTKRFGRQVGAAGATLGAEAGLGLANVAGKLGAPGVQGTLAKGSEYLAQTAAAERELQDLNKPSDIVKNVGEAGVGAFGEIGSFLVPGGQLGTGTTARRIGSAGLQGAEMGFLQGVTRPGTVEERLTGGVEKAATGAVTGALFQTAGEGIKKVAEGTKSLREKGYDTIASTFKDNKTTQKIINNKYGGDANKFAKEIVDNKIPKTKGGVIKEIQKLNSKYENEVTNKLKLLDRQGASKSIDFDTALKEVTQDIADIHNLGTPLDQRITRDAKKYLETFANKEKNMNLESANRLRKQLDRQFTGTALADIKSGEKLANDLLANKLRGAVQENAPITQSFFKKYSLLKDAELIYTKEPKLGFNELVGALVAGTTFGNPIAAGIGAVGARVAKSPGLTRTVGENVSNIGKSVRNVDTTRLDALRRALVASVTR